MASKIIHITDLYHPYADPDDHYDLAQIFALSKIGDIEIEQVIIDYPKTDDYGSPAISAVYQLNQLTDSNVHVTIGANAHLFAGKPELWKIADKHKVWAAEKIIEILKKADEKVYITIVGGCLDTAIALERSSETFKEKCAGIILNAGSAINQPDHKEYNVLLGALEYSKVFCAPCPVFWNPCFHKIGVGIGHYGTYYHFLQKEILNNISKELANYFIFMLSKSKNCRFLSLLKETTNEELIKKFGEQYRNKWCTGSIFDIAGKAVTLDGKIVAKRVTNALVYGYEPIKIKCTPQGDTEWVKDSSSTNRFIFCVKDKSKYESAMTKALATVLNKI